MVNYLKLAEFMNDNLEIATLKDADRIRNKGAAAVVLKLGLLKPSNGFRNVFSEMQPLLKGITVKRERAFRRKTPILPE